MFNALEIRSDFPILSRKINGKPLIYLDNAATSQKPRVMIDAISNYYSTSNANVHRGVHTLSDESTQAWEQGRQTIAEFFGAQSDELIITRNTTEAINGIAYGWADAHLQAGDVILSTPMEHHSDLVVWQQVCKRTGATLEYLEVNSDGRLELAGMEEILANPKLKFVALTHVSNALGTKNPIEKIIQQIKSKRPEIRIAIDGAQSAPHMTINFKDLGADFYSFSGHKMLGPMGIGGLLVRKTLMDSNEFQPWLFGGGMIATVDRENTVFAESLADRFTAGTPDVASIVGLAAACQYLKKLGMDNIEEQDRKLTEYAVNHLRTIPELHLIGPVNVQNGELDRVGSVAFMYDQVHAHDVAQVLDSEGIAVRSGHHCTMPLHTQFNWQATVRISFQVYNSKKDVDALIAALEKVKYIFKK